MNVSDQTVVTLTLPITSADSTRPLFIRTLSPRPNQLHTGGYSSGGMVQEEYVQLSVLPDDLKNRVITAIQALMVP